jgi:hypothetical protein
MTKKWAYLWIMGMIVAAIIVCVNGIKVQRHKTNRIDAYVRYTCKHLLNPHAGRIATSQGHRHLFSNVRTVI